MVSRFRSGGYRRAGFSEVGPVQLQQRLPNTMRYDDGENQAVFVLGEVVFMEHTPNYERKKYSSWGEKRDVEGVTSWGDDGLLIESDVRVPS